MIYYESLHRTRATTIPYLRPGLVTYNRVPREHISRDPGESVHDDGRILLRGFQTRVRRFRINKQVPFAQHVHAQARRIRKW